MTATVCLAVPSTLHRQGHGAYLWIFINWALGFKARGCKVYWLENVPRQAAQKTGLSHQRAIDEWRRRFDAHGLGEDLVLYSFQEERTVHPPGMADFFDSDLLVNFVYRAPDSFLRRFRRSALVDIDPGLLQSWMSRGQVRVSEHDVYFTIGETVGTASARFSSCGVDWHFTPPPVYLPAWPVTTDRGAGRFTTVTGWWDEWMELNGEVFSNEKRTAFLEYVTLPERVAGNLELAIILDKETLATDVPVLEKNGWFVADAQKVCETPGHFRQYVQNSRGEFTCSRPSSGRLGSTWISDRTLCYLAK